MLEQSSEFLSLWVSLSVLVLFFGRSRHLVPL